MPAKIAPPNDQNHLIKDLDRKVHWLASWTIHNANHLRESRDGLKVGGHQASHEAALVGGVKDEAAG